MDFEELVYGNTCYLNDNGFIIRIMGKCIFTYKDGDSEYFKWEEVCDDLEPLIIIFYNRGLFNSITICNGNANLCFDDLNLNNIFKRISEIDILDVIINC